MASVFHLYNDAFNIKRKIVQKYSDFAETDKKLYFSAVAIQRTWRGYALRKSIAKWHKAATIIQRFVRGWLVRLHLSEIYKQYYYDLGVAHYNKQATVIQASWRSYLVRKAKPSIKSLLQERSLIATLSNELQEQINDLFLKMKAEKLTERQEYVQKILAILFNRHHLLRTRTQEGVFSIHGSYELSCIEKILKRFPLTEYMKKWRKFSKKDFEVLYYNDHYQKERKEFDLYTRARPKPYNRMLQSQDK